MNVRSLVALSLSLLSLGCLEGSTGPLGGGAPQVLLRVTGGIAGVDYTLFLDGPRGEVVGELCVSGCSFRDGDILVGVTADQASYLAQLFQDADILALDGTDFGNECCDQFHYEATYADSEGTSQVRGTSEAMPLALREALEVVAGFAQDVYPIVVDMNTGPDAWPGDSFTYQDIRIQGDKLMMDITHGGGCAQHHFALVAHGGWMESDPVKISTFLSHDGHGDMCDALLLRNLTFDLLPLKMAYQEAYGVGAPGETTLILWVERGDIYSSLQYQPVEYVF